MPDIINPITVRVIGFDQEAEIAITKLIREITRSCSTSISTQALDGITFAKDYKKALEDIERGHNNKIKSTPSNDYGIGIGISVRVTRNNQPMHHVVINGEVFLNQIASNHSEIAVNTIVHELAHTDLYNRYEAAFPGDLNSIPENFLDQFRNACMLDCWNEFGACWMSAGFGPTDITYYEPSFLAALENTKAIADQAIIEYQTDRNPKKLISIVTGEYRLLLKYSAYHLGNLYGHDADWRKISTTALSLKSHWFLPFFEDLDKTCKSIANNIKNWKTDPGFDALRKLAEDLVAYGGLSFQRHSDGRTSFEINDY